MLHHRPSRFVLALTLFSVAALISGSVAAADPPEVAAGECLWLVGAPPGEPAAAIEARDGAAGRYERCDNDLAGGAFGRNGDDVVEAWIPHFVIPDSPNRYPGSCRVFAWVSHGFRVAEGGSQRLPVSVKILGYYAGTLEGHFKETSAYEPVGVRLRLELQEWDAGTETWSHLARETVLERELQRGLRRLEDRFGQTLEGEARPGRIYRVRLSLEAYTRLVWRELLSGGSNAPLREVFFGEPGSQATNPRHARYDAIEVCVGEPEDHTEVLAAVEANADGIAENADGIARAEAQAEANANAIAELRALLEDHAQRSDEERLEWELLNKDCRPGLWLPAAEGGRLEEARALVARRLEGALASGAPGVNAKVAEDRLAEADRLAAAGSYQKSCRRLSDALRALTTP